MFFIGSHTGGQVTVGWKVPAVGTPVIVVTGFASEQSRRQALAAGATAYLAKPFSTSALTSLIREALAPPST